MDQQFLETLYRRHQDTEAVPPTSKIGSWANQVFNLLFPEQAKDFFPSVHEIEGEIWNLGNELKHILNATDQCKKCDNEERAEKFKAALPELFRVLNTDVKAILEGDPAAVSEFEVIRAYPGFKAIAYYRLAHLLLQMEVNLIPRILTEYVHGLTGIDIHPAAKIGEHFFIDHGSGIVIGGTSVIGKNVKIYQGVTLGALSVEKEMANVKRHPTVEDGVVIYANATILGGETTIGEGSVIGGNVWLTKSVPANSVVYHKPEIQVKEKELV
ncbi:serine O-acetyltransferase EpsC [Jiulongibacter sediminis]|uniref:Serine acetyltransferase n=1 Tax=Jiulongibacter sediminis TaxID=1605367 RepID=A0A0P7C1C1_9BACT|nr:serine O-acetyltransferase EpsC [Jiulongibacter sediminis]KPM47120.1 serine acetyltransferase [Jiulongibacter sediminis]TBX22681.1 serine acetyltransferase [Jiulongibacter sediminis]